MKAQTWGRTVFFVTGAFAFLAGTAFPSESSPPAKEFWLAVREDGREGTGTEADPFDAGGPERFHALFDRFERECGDGLVVHFGPGVYLGTHMIRPRDNWKIRGAGIDVTILRTRPDPDAIDTVGFRAGGYTGGPAGFEISDMTIDLNTQNLRRADHAFLYPVYGGMYNVGYCRLESAPEWNPSATYEGRSYSSVVTHGDGHYIALETNNNTEPSQGKAWARLYPTDPADLPTWESGSSYRVGEAVSYQGLTYFCTRESSEATPGTDTKVWCPVDPMAPDPRVYTNAVFVGAVPPRGGHRVSRLKVLNGYGNFFLFREAFLIGLGGDDCVIEDCTIEDFRGDYATQIALFYGHNSAVRNCTVRFDRVPTPYAVFAYGGWACYDTVFENNYASGMGMATNIDSLTSRNVTFRNNTFMNCAHAGILVNVSGKPVPSCRDVTATVAGKLINIAESRMDGLFITGNLVEVRDDAINAAIEVQSDGLENVLVSGNILRTLSGEGAATAIKSYGDVRNLLVTGNTCDPNMTFDLAPGAVCRDNFDLEGRPIPGDD